MRLANLYTPTRCLIEFQLHIMARPSEAAGALWSEINREEKLWEISAERMKLQFVEPTTARAIWISAEA